MAKKKKGYGGSGKSGGRPAILALTAGIGKKVAKAKPASIKAGRAVARTNRRTGAVSRGAATKSLKQAGLTKGVAPSRTWRKKAR